MRRLGYLFALCLFAATGCDDDDDDDDVTFDAPPISAPDASTPDIDSGGGVPDATANIDSGGGVGMAPEITQVTWEPMGACSAGTASNYRITVDATDQD